MLRIVAKFFIFREVFHSNTEIVHFNGLVFEFGDVLFLAVFCYFNENEEADNNYHINEHDQHAKLLFTNWLS